MDFLNHREGGMTWFSISFSSFLLYGNCKRLCEFEEIESKAVEVAENKKKENSYDFCLDFLQEFGLWY